MIFLWCIVVLGNSKSATFYIREDNENAKKFIKTYLNKSKI